MWRATCRKVSRQACAKDFNPRPPWGGRQCKAVAVECEGVFQSTPSVGRATVLISSLNTNGDTFQSTPSVGRATIRPHHLSFCLFYFNPRPPWGGRRRKRGRSPRPLRISIHALRGEGDRAHFILEYQRRHISIHALRGEGDFVKRGNIQACDVFQSTPSVGRATFDTLGFPIFIRFQSTPSVGRATK